MKKFIPTFSDALSRYIFALERCKGLDVLDAGSNIGAGSHLLSYGAKRITLADNDDKCLKFSQKCYRYFCPVTFVKCDLEKDFPEGKWDIIVAFETIEHLANPEFFIKNVSEHLNKGGKLIFSVPHMVSNRLHKTLFDQNKIEDLINRFLWLEWMTTQGAKYLEEERPLYKGLKHYVGVAIKK